MASGKAHMVSLSRSMDGTCAAQRTNFEVQACGLVYPACVLVLDIKHITSTCLPPALLFHNHPSNHPLSFTLPLSLPSALHVSKNA